MADEPSPLTAWEDAERAATEAEQQLFDQTLSAHGAQGLPSRADVDRVRDLRLQASRLMLAAAEARARMGRPHWLRSSCWLAPGIAGAVAFLLLPRLAADACNAASCDWWAIAADFSLLALAGSLAAFLVAFAADHLYGAYARDLERWENGLPRR